MISLPLDETSVRTAACRPFRDNPVSSVYTACELPGIGYRWFDSIRITDPELDG